MIQRQSYSQSTHFRFPTNHTEQGDKRGISKQAASGGMFSFQLNLSNGESIATSALNGINEQTSDVIMFEGERPIQAMKGILRR